MTQKQMKALGVDDGDFECILAEDDVLGGYFDDCLPIDEEDDE